MSGKEKIEKSYHTIPKNPTSVASIGFFEDPNLRYRKTMEDGHVLLDGLKEKSDGFFAIYDGHGKFLK